MSILYDDVKDVCEDIRLGKKISHFKLDMVRGRFEREWIRIMAYSDLYNKMKFTYSLNNIEFKDYGIVSDIYIVPPLTFEKIENLRDMIQENLGCLILFNHSKVSPWINTRFVFNPQETKHFAVVPQTYPYELYIGNDYAGEPIIIDVNKYTHVGEYGGTRSGKSVQQSVMLTNLIANIKPQDVQLYLCQVAKSDLILFRACEHTKAFAHTLEETYAVLDYIVNEEMPRREKMIEPYRECAKASNFKDYNSLKKTDKITMTYVVFDEMSSLFQEKDKEKKKIKDAIVYLTEEISRYGASLGVCLMCSLQRPTRDNLSPMIKSQCTSVVSFRQNNSKSSEVAIDDATIALGLEMREFVYRLASKNVEYGIVPWVKDIELEEIIKPWKKPHRTLFDDLKKRQHRDGVTKDKVKMEDVGTHIKTEKEMFEEGMSKIPNVVPYDNYNGMTIIDEKDWIKRKEDMNIDNENEYEGVVDEDNELVEYKDRGLYEGRVKL